MSVMIKLRLSHPSPTFSYVRSLPGMEGLDLEESYGLVCISPKESLYVVRASSVDDIQTRKALSPEIQDAYGEVRIGTFDRNDS